ncbi:MAG: recombinase family protein [Bacillota bacterium]
MENIYNLINYIICYLRRSRQDIEREKRTGEDTLGTQKKIMVKVLDDLKIPYDTEEEIGSGDKIETRPVFQQVLFNLEQGKYNAVAVKEIPRLGRGDYSDMGQIYELIRDKRIFIITPYKIYDPQNPADLRQIRFELFFAREEFEMIKERLISARYSLAHEGKWVAGATPFGYTLNRNTTRLEIIEEEAQIVRLIFTIYAYGLETEDSISQDVSFRAIATYLTRIGIPTPRGASSWNFMSVRRILENVAYIGTVKFRSRKRVVNRYYDRPQSEWIVVEFAHEPIIDMETWNITQAKLKKSRIQPHVKLDFSPCELAGIVVCAKCGYRMVRQCSTQHYKKKTGGTSIYHKEFLWCPTPGCTCVKYRDVETSILTYLKTLRDFDVERLKQSFENIYRKQRETIIDLNTNEIVEKRKAELKRRLKFVCDRYESGIYDDQLFLERKSEIEKELLMLQSVTPIQQSEDFIDKEMYHLKANIKTFLETYQQLENKTLKNKLLSELINVVYLEKTGKGQFNLAIHPRFSFEYKQDQNTAKG